MAAVEAGDEDGFLDAFEADARPRARLRPPLGDDELEGSDVMLPPPDTDFVEASTVHRRGPDPGLAAAPPASGGSGPCRQRRPVVASRSERSRPVRRPVPRPRHGAPPPRSGFSGRRGQSAPRTRTGALRRGQVARAVGGAPTTTCCSRPEALAQRQPRSAGAGTLRSGSTARTSVPRPGGLVTLSVPSQAPSGRPAR